MKVLYCHCAQAQVLPKDVKDQVLARLCESGVDFEPVADLCAMAAKRDPRLKELANGGPVQIIACHERAVRGLFRAAGAELPKAGVEILDMRGQPADQLVAALKPGNNGATAAKLDETKAKLQPPAAGQWAGWFPVIDYDRCTNCMQCLSFCLFGVYGATAEGKITVQTSENCKPNCPACSRVCPEVAIMFPKYSAAPINGAPVSEADLQREKMKVDISSLLGGNIYQALRDRQERAKSRFSKERDSDRAIEERRKCLVKLQQAGDIPLDVLSSLPSPDEILRRAEQAKAAAQAALEQQAKSSA
jgi:Pyruvate/2-oxoacid:ferredoxin oxidoreductase delta subunit